MRRVEATQSGSECHDYFYGYLACGWQVMASGMTAVPGQDQSCTGGRVGWGGRGFDVMFIMSAGVTRNIRETNVHECN